MDTNKTKINVRFGDTVIEAVETLKANARKAGFHLEHICLIPSAGRRATEIELRGSINDTPADELPSSTTITLKSGETVVLEFADIGRITGTIADDGSITLWATGLDQTTTPYEGMTPDGANVIFDAWRAWTDANQDILKPWQNDVRKPSDLDTLRLDIAKMTLIRRGEKVRYQDMLDALKSKNPTVYADWSLRFLINSLAQLGYGVHCYMDTVTLPDTMFGLYLLKQYRAKGGKAVETPTPTIKDYEGCFIKQFPRVLECSGLNTMALGYEAIVEVYKALDPIVFGKLDKAGAKEVLAVMGRMGKLKDCYIRDDSVQGLVIKGGSLLKAVQNMEDEALLGKEAIQFIWPAPDADTEGTSYTELLARLKEYRPAVFGSWDVARLKAAWKRIDEFSPINDARVLEHGLGRVLLVPETVLATRGIVKEPGDGGESQLTDHFDPETDRIFREHFAVLCTKYSLQSYTPINAGNVLKSLINNWPECYSTWNEVGVAHAITRMFEPQVGE